MQRMFEPNGSTNNEHKLVLKITNIIGELLNSSVFFKCAEIPQSLGKEMLGV